LSHLKDLLNYLPHGLTADRPGGVGSLKRLLHQQLGFPLAWTAGVICLGTVLSWTGNNSSQNKINNKIK
jgi:hypothetical protein